MQAPARVCRPPQNEPRRTKVAPHLPCFVRSGIWGDAHAEDYDLGRCRDVSRGIQRGCARTCRQRRFGRAVRGRGSGTYRRRRRSGDRLHGRARHRPFLGNRGFRTEKPPSVCAETLSDGRCARPRIAGRASEEYGCRTVRWPQCRRRDRLDSDSIGKAADTVGERFAAASCGAGIRIMESRAADWRRFLLDFSRI
jgi:hypothetical protein